MVVAELASDGFLGRGEAVPYGRYGETIEGVLAALEAVRDAVEAGRDRAVLQTLSPPGAARAAARRPLLKLKIGGADDIDRVEAVRAAAPKARLIVDANEALSFEDLRRLAPALASLRVKLLEQPLPAGEDQALEGYDSPAPLCADESIHTRGELDAVARRYAFVNIKLDKAGGLTEALALRAAAEGRGLEVMAGCMVGTSLAMAPALLIAQGAAFVDLDGPLLLARDRTPGLTYLGSMIEPPTPALWG